MSMSKSVSNSLILMFASIGCFVTLVLFYEHLRPNADIGCRAVGGNCVTANESDYGHVGKVPTSIFGFAMYATLVGICLKRQRLLATNHPPSVDALESDPDDDIGDVDMGTDAFASPSRYQDTEVLTPIRKQLRTMDLVVWLIAAPAIGISWWLQNVSLYKLVSFCPWCMGSAFLVTLIFLLATKDLFLDNRQLTGEQKLLLGTVTFIAAMSFLMVLPDIMRRIDMARSMTGAEYTGPHITKPKDPPIKTGDMEVTGPADAPYTIVEFADYQCPHCQKASVMLTEELRKNPKRFRFAFRNYPLPSHHWAMPAALCAEAAGEQGKFWQMHDYLFAHQAEMDKNTFNQDDFTKYAANLGLNSEKFEQDVVSDKIMTRVATDSTTARQIKVVMTPTFFIFGRKGRVYQLTGMEKMKAALDDTGDEAWK